MADIELIIKISEEKYDTIKSDLYNTFPAEMKEWGLEAIRNGTPIIESDDCISRAEAIKALNCKISGSIESDIDLSKYKREFQEFADMVINAQEKAIQALPPVKPKSIEEIK